ncbi:tetratricopeptide repeat protein [Pseudoalteromonas sp. SSDWG2]|uniref:tetratricopeptide repeat protein n=1 Tax=Pseudoalteromonas sp. SSDWG2 TaxID=3139391 RepID=UPI003BA9A1EA
MSAESSLSVLPESKLADAAQQSIEIYEQVAALYPNSAYAFSNLASAYASVGKLEKAIELQNIAVEKSKEMVQWHQNNLQNILDEYQKQLGTDNVQ